MTSAILAAVGVVTLVTGLALLALTGWLWFGDWPQESKRLIDYYRSTKQRGAHTGDAWLQDVQARSHKTSPVVRIRVAHPGTKLTAISKTGAGRSTDSTNPWKISRSSRRSIKPSCIESRPSCFEIKRDSSVRARGC